MTRQPSLICADNDEGSIGCYPFGTILAIHHKRAECHVESRPICMTPLPFLDVCTNFAL